MRLPGFCQGLSEEPIGGSSVDRFDAFFLAYPLMAVYFFGGSEAVGAMLITGMPRSAVWFAASVAVAVGVALPASGLFQQGSYAAGLLSGWTG